MSDTNKNFLGTAPVKDLMLKFSIPSIIAMMVSALYNIVDQIFISLGQHGGPPFALFIVRRRKRL